MMWLAVSCICMVLWPLFLWGVASVCLGARLTSSIKREGVALIVLFCFTSIGEALNPGPSPTDFADEFVLGICNPTGLRNKAPYVVSQMAHGDLWLFSETHLCTRELRAFNASMKFASSPFQPLLGGFPVPDSPDNSGRWKGVGVLSKTPVRHIPQDWSSTICKSARAMVFTTMVDDAWLTGGLVYGEPDGRLYPERLANTEALLQAVVSTVGFMATGPRVIAGDWNVEFGDLPVFDLLASAGFKDLQDLAAERWGLPLRPTCKATTRKDYCFISKELQDLLCHVSVQSDLWPDHAVVHGSFHRLRQVVPHDVWRRPAPFPWPKHWTVDPNAWTNLEGTLDDRYMQMWAHFENTATACLPFPVSRSMKGRGATKHLKSVKPGHLPPLRWGRNGDFQPHFFGASLRHAQWIRQVRRLQSYMRCVHTHAPASSHATALWASILRATGFPEGFSQWWMGCKSRVHGAPSFLPGFPPDSAVAIKIFESMALAVRSLEMQLRSTSKQYARLRRARNPNQIFRDLKEAPASGVDYLLQPLRAKVSEVRAEDLAIVVDPPQPWSHDLDFWCNGVKLDPVHVTDDCLWLQDVGHCASGDSVTQLKCTGTKTALADAFISSWQERWDRHKDVPPERWDTILAFARAHLVRVPIVLSALTAECLMHLISTKKRSSASGLDGVSIDDLQSLPLSALQNVCAMYQEAESSGAWPSQLLMGKVACLAKVEQPRSVMDYRPITVLSLLYRLWGSFYSHHIMQQLDSSLPETLYGSRPSRFAGQAWSQLLWAVEDSHAQGVSLTGLIADLQKAFNHIPRLVVFEAAALLGVPMHVLCGWAGALSQLGRRFQLGPNLTRAIFSVTGLPEGDGLSCVGMVVVDILFHLWHQKFFPLCQPISYVDDWTVLTTSPALMSGIFECLQEFTDALDLLLDTKKTFAWSTSSAGRKSLKSQGFRVVDNCRMLGAHLQTTRKHTNSTQMERIQAVKGLWLKLRLSAASYGVKVRAIRTAAWPKALHAIAATSVSKQAFKSLRAAAMKGLRAEGSGCSSIVHLGLCENPMTDPWFWTIAQTFRLVRDCGIPEVIQAALQALVRGDSGVMLNGITATLLGRLQTLGWHVTQVGMCVDDFGSFSLSEISIEELMWRSEWAWLKVVASEVRHRPGLSDLHMVDPAKTRRWLWSLDASDQAMVRKLLNGAHITQDGKHYCQEVATDVCLYCSSSDSRFHRFWGCPAFQDCRQTVSEDLWQAIPSLPESVVCHGWALRPTTWVEWFSYLADILPRPIHVTPLAGFMHVFTDGSCHNSNYPDARFAAYSAVVAHVDGSSPTILDCGPLPGIRQTSVRAELYAVARVIKFAVAHGVSVMIWSDCLSVVRRLRRVLLGAPVKCNSPNADLWRAISEDVHLGLDGSIRITKVAAHTDLRDATSPLEDWCGYHNHYADRIAVSANSCRPAHFWNLLQRHLQACLQMDSWNSEIRTVLLRVSRLVVRNADLQVEHDPPDVPPQMPVSLPWTALPPEPCLPPGAIRWYGEVLVTKITKWFWDALSDSDAAVEWIAYSQLYADFALSTGEPGPLKLQSWCDGSDIPHHRLLQFGFKMRVKWFAKVLREILRHGGLTICAGYQRPKSFMLASFSGCLALPWPEQRLIAVDNWFQCFTDQPFRRQSKALDSLPVPLRDTSFPRQ